MRILNVKTAAIFLAMALAGCSAATEAGKVLWGSSTFALEKARPQAVKATLRCAPQDCFEAALDVVEHRAQMDAALAQEQQPGRALDDEPIVQKRETIDLASLSGLHVFIKDPRRKVIVLMGVPEANNTTEVGLFFSPAPEGTLLEISSLSKRAKDMAAELLLPEIQKSCPLAASAPDPKTPPSQP